MFQVAVTIAMIRIKVAVFVTTIRLQAKIIRNTVNAAQYQLVNNNNKKINLISAGHWSSRPHENEKPYMKGTRKTETLQVINVFENCASSIWEYGDNDNFVRIWFLVKVRGSRKRHSTALNVIRKLLVNRSCAYAKEEVSRTTYKCDTYISFGDFPSATRIILRVRIAAKR